MAPHPPCRVGDFILTFPFNRATLRASRDGLDVRTAVQEVSKLAAQLTSRRSQAERRKRRKEEEGPGVCGGRKEEEEYLFWGPKNPPLLREFCISN